MKVQLAKKAGFCMGVKRAMDIVLELSEKINGTLHTYGPLIHNPQVIDLLEKKGIKVINDLSGIPAGAPLVIRTHGITPEKRREIKEKGIDIKDATCPLVMKVQSIIKRYADKGYSTIIVGDEGHAEINALMGFTQGRGFIINSEEDVFRLPAMDKVCVVAQTTLNSKKFKEITEKVKTKYPHVEIENTICNATESRQSEALAICSPVDAMIVVGGRNSANTNRLASICSSSGTPTFLVETEKELSERELLKFNTIGITAGASTPNWMIRRIIDKVEGMKRKKKNLIVRGISDIGEFIIKSNIYTAIGGLCITYTSCMLQNIKPRISYLLLSLLYLFSMYVLNNFTDQEVIKLTTPGKTEFLKKNKTYFITWGTFALILSLLIALGLGIAPFILLLLSSALGVVYSIKLIPSANIKFIKYQRLKDIPGSKDIFVSLAWSVVTVLIPFFSVYNKNFSPENIATFLFVFIIVYIRSVLFDIKDIQGDKIVGRETIPIIIGKEKTKLFLAVIASITAIMLVTSTMIGWFTSLGYFLLLSVLYICIYLYLYHKRVISQGLSFEGVVDGSFIISGVIALLV